MGELRTFLRARYLLAAGLIAFALAMKVLVPAGYMLNHSAAGSVLTICPNANPGMNLDREPVPHSAHHADHASQHVDGMSHDVHNQGDEHGKQGGHGADNTCPYSLMPIASLSGADGVQLAIALIFILALGYAAVASPRLTLIPFLRPPLRGPPELLG